MRSRPARALPVIIVLMAIASSFVWLPGSDRTPVVHVSGRERAAVSLPSPEAQSPEGNRAAEETPAPIPPAVRAPEIPPAMADRVLTDVTPAAPVVVPMAAPMARATSEPVPSATTELPAELEEPPEVPAAPPPATESLPRITEILSPAPVALPARFVTVEMDVADRPSRTGFLHGLALGKRRDSGTKFIAPKPLRDNTPEVPAELRRRIAREVFIAVKVFVDRTGKVEFAELLSDGTGPNRELAMLSVFSSRRWQFSPAQVDGVPVPAEVVLRFHFTREARPVE